MLALNVRYHVSYSAFGFLFNASTCSCYGEKIFKSMWVGNGIATKKMIWSCVSLLSIAFEFDSLSFAFFKRYCFSLLPVQEYICMYLSLYISGSCMSTLRHKYKRKRCLLKRWWWCGCKLFLEKFLKSWTTFLLRFLFLFYLCARMPAQVHRLENMY